MDIRYALGEIREKGTDPSWWRNRFIDHVIGRYFRVISSNGTPVIDLDWDNLILLDACRYDLFEETLADYPLPGSLSQRTAAASATPAFLEANFAHRDLHDIVYVTANPYVNTELEESRFHAIVAVWQDGWDDELQTVSPEIMLERTLQANEMYPEKRIISHFLQPHFPFIGEKRLGERKVTVVRQRALGEKETGPEDRVPTPFDQVQHGELSREEVWEAYRSNLERALPAVEELLMTLSGKTAVTSDHGNAIGEFAWPFPLRIYGHPMGVTIPALTDVPWLIHENGGRKVVVPEAPTQVETEVPSNRADRLRALGYVE